MECEATRHGQFHTATKRVMVTFRGSVASDQELYPLVKGRADKDGVDFADVVRAALWQYVAPRRKI